MDEPHATEPVEPVAIVYWMLLENTSKTHLKTSKTVNVIKFLLTATKYAS
jgi:hypothetical protein